MQPYKYKGKDMSKFYVDNKDREATYIDKINQHYAGNDEIVKLGVIRDNETDTRKAIAELLAMTLGLRGHSIRAFVTMICHCNGVCKSKFYLAKETVKYYDLDVIPQTIAQVIELMFKDFIFLLDDKYSIKINPKYYVPENAADAKFLVIELNPKETSVPIEL